LKLAALFVIGILIENQIAVSIDLLLILFFALVIVAFLAFIVSPRHQSAAVVLIAIVACLSILSGAAKLRADRDRTNPVPDTLLNCNVFVIGQVVEPPHVKNKSSRFSLRGIELRGESASLPIEHKIRVTMRFLPHRVQPKYGMTIGILGSLSRPSDARNPGEFSEKQYYEANGTTLFCFGRDFVVLDSSRGSWLMTDAVIPLRSYIVQTIDRNFSGEAREFIRGLLVGDRSGITASTRQAFANSGVSHILAVSGAHVVVVAGIFVFLFGLIRFPRWALGTSTICGLVLFTLITGSHPPVVRATITASIFILGGLFQVRSSPFNSLGVAALVVLGMDARQLFDVGFQLSFAAVFSIIYLYPIMNGLISSIDVDDPFVKIIVWILRVCAVSFAATLGTFPFTAIYFGRVSVIGLLANIVVIPTVGLAMTLGFVTLIFSAINSTIALSFSAVAEVLLNGVLLLTSTIGRLPFAYVDTTRFFPVYSFPFYAGLLLLFNFASPNKARKLLIALLAAFNVAIFWPSPKSIAGDEHELRVSFLDVGQGDAAVIEFPDGKVMLVDAGMRSSSYNAGERTVIPFLKRRGISRIDELVVSHPHEDHLGGMPRVIEQCDIGAAVESGQPINTGTYQTYLKDIQREGCTRILVQEGDRIDCTHNARVYVLSPEPSFLDTDLTHRSLNFNNTSVVLKVVYGNISFLFSGDAEAEAEDEMTKVYGDFLHSTVLKTGHHGSSTSSTPEYLNAVNPEDAVISVGRFNKFHHPSPAVLERFDQLHVNVFRTDEDGAVIFETDGSVLNRVEWR
jgi:competence protein ComEC